MQDPADAAAADSDPLEPFLLAGDPDLEDEVHHSDPKGELYLRPYSRVYLAEKWDVLGVPNLVVYHLPTRTILTQHARFDLLKENKIESTWQKWSEGEKIEFGVAGACTRVLLSLCAPPRPRPGVRREIDTVSPGVNPRYLLSPRSRLRPPLVDRARRRRVDVRHQRPDRSDPRRDHPVDRELLQDVPLRGHPGASIRLGRGSRIDAPGYFGRGFCSFLSFVRSPAQSIASGMRRFPARCTL